MHFLSTQTDVACSGAQRIQRVDARGIDDGGIPSPVTDFYSRTLLEESALKNEPAGSDKKMSRSDLIKLLNEDSGARVSSHH